jgi:hypothetical protein
MGSESLLRETARSTNDIEIVWGDLKARHLAHQTFTDLDCLDSTIHHAVSGLNSARKRDQLATSARPAGRRSPSAPTGSP